MLQTIIPSAARRSPHFRGCAAVAPHFRGCAAVAPAFRATGALALLATALAGCATMPTPRNAPDAQYQPMQRLAAATPATCVAPATPPDLAVLTRIDPAALADAPAVLAPGDRLTVQVAGDVGTLSGTYVVGADGRVAIAPDLVVPAGGVDRAAFEANLRGRLVAGGWVRDIAGNVRVGSVETAGVMVSVEGAVFQPGVQMAGDRPVEQRNAISEHPAVGDFNGGRTLTAALQAAGGLRPDAWPDAIYVVRGHSYARIDVRPALVGGVGGEALPTTLQLAQGDRIVVPSTGCFDATLVRPSPVTTPGMRVYLSNLARGGGGNAAAPVSHDATGLPYGTRLLQGLVQANCVGGSAFTAERSAVLISRNPVNGRAVVISRSVEALVRNADRDDVDPYLMPGDAIACYDSRMMTVSDAAGLLGNLLGPAALVKGLGL